MSEKIAAEEREKEAIRVKHRAQVRQVQKENYEEKWKEFEAALADTSFGPQPKLRYPHNATQLNAMQHNATQHHPQH